MKQLTRCPGPSKAIWVVWAFKVDGPPFMRSWWRATGMFSERQHAEEHARPGDRVMYYSYAVSYRARAPHTILEPEALDAE